MRSTRPEIVPWVEPELAEQPLGQESYGYPANSLAVKPGATYGPLKLDNRWFLPYPAWRRYMDPAHETPYQYDRSGPFFTPELWHPYRQSLLKADLPIIGQDIFLNITAKNFTLFERRKLPTPSGVSAATANAPEFYGRSEQTQISNDASLTLELFQGSTAFKPVHWAVRVTGTYNNNWIRVKENGVIDPDPRGTEFDDNYGRKSTKQVEAIPAASNSFNPQDGIPAPFTRVINPADAFNLLAPQLKPVGEADTLVKVDPLTNEAGKGEKKGKKEQRKDLAGSRYTIRHRNFFALQEAFIEYHLGDLTDNYDFWSSRWGIQPFVSDFRGFIFNDTNLGARIFGNYDNNRIQYNLAYFNMREKDTYSDLNTFDSRHQQVFIANLYRQDFIWKGYTAQVSFHMNHDDGGTHYDKNGFLVRPAILGTVYDEADFAGVNGNVRGHDVKAYYLGWTGDGHIERLNITHALYYAFGEDDFNPVAGRKVDIDAWMAALELSYDRDWIRFKLSGFFASGDSDPDDRRAQGFDTILDAPLFIGGPFSWYTHQGFNLGGTAVNFKSRDSLIPTFRSSKTQGQANFVNPGVSIIGIGSDIDVTPKLKAFVNANYIWINETASIERLLQSNKIRNQIGLDLSLGFRYRPLLTENIVFQLGAGVLLPGAGYRDIYRRSTEPVPGYGPSDEAGKVDRYLYNIFTSVTLIW